jgi:hypothetical protein
MKNLFEISSEERNRILEMHISATKKQYLIETISKLKVTVVDSDKKPIVGAVIVDLGDKYNGGVTDFDGVVILNKFTGPSFSVNMTGYASKEVTPDNEDVNVTMETSTTTLSGVEIKNKDFYGKVIDSESKKSIEGAKVHGFNDNAEDNKEFTWTTDKKGEFKSGLGYNPLTISAEGYDSLDYSVDENYVLDKKNPTIIELTKTYVAPPPSVIPTELESLIGKEFLFFDADRKRPLQGTITEIYYVDNKKLKSVEFKLSNIKNGNVYTLTFDCIQAAFKVRGVSDSQSKLKGTFKSIGAFAQNDFLYSPELRKYLKNYTNTCGWNQTT